MTEYTLIAVFFVIASIALDRILKTNLIKDKRFWRFWAIMFLVMCLVNGYLTWRPVVIYGDPFFLGMRLFTIPIEDFLFGFSLLTSNIVLWEYFTKRNSKNQNDKLENPNVN